MKLDNVADIYPLSPLQLGMLYHMLAEPGSGVYVQQLVIRLGRPVDSVALLSAWSTIAERNSILRTAFLWDGLDEPVQVVRQHVDIPWIEDDWSNLDPKDFRTRLDALLIDDRRRGFDPALAPLLRLRLIHSSVDESLLVWSFHHILLDGWSTNIVVHELRSLYAADVTGQSLELPTARPYRDYIEHLQHADRTDSEAFWQEYLGDFSEPTPFGFDRPVRHLTDQAVRTTKHALSEDLTQRLSLFARKNRVTLNTVAHGAWSLLLGLCSSRQDVVYGFTVTDRPPDIHGSEHMVGVFINTLPIRVQIDPDDPIGKWIQDLQGSLLDIQSHAQSPLFEVKRLSGVSTDQPLFESLLVFENYPVQRDTTSHELDIRGVEYFEQSNYALALLFVPGTQLQIITVYESSRFEDGAVSVLMEQFVSLLEQMTLESTDLVRHVRPQLTDLSILRGPTVDWIFTPVHQQIIQTAACHPGQTAVSCEGSNLSYAELSQKSASIAARLTTLDLKPGEPVCLALDRSVDMVTAILGVLRAGGAYVPVDPSTPPSRTKQLVFDCGARVLITDRSFEPTPDLPDMTRIVVQDVDDDITNYTEGVAVR
jgi:hypothetical protein